MSIFIDNNLQRNLLRSIVLVAVLADDEPRVQMMPPHVPHSDRP